MFRVLRAECSPPRAAIHPDRAATPHARIAAAVTADRAGTVGAATVHRGDTAEAVTAHRRAAIAHLADTADRPTVAVRPGDIVAEATPRRRRTAQARSAAAADTLGHVGASEGTLVRAAAPMAGVVRTVVAVRMVAEAATVAIANT